MTSFVVLRSQHTLDAVLRVLLRYPFFRFLNDFLHGLLDLLDQYEAIKPLYYLPMLLFLRIIVIAGYTYGANMDHRAMRGEREGVVIMGKGGEWVVVKESNDAEREKRMGTLGQPCPPSEPLSSQKLDDVADKTSIKAAVVCLVYLCTDSDVRALESLSDRLATQTRAPDLIVFVDDGSPLALGAEEKSTEGPAFRHLRLPENRGPAAARNAGIDFAVSALGNEPERTIILLLDLDCIPPLEWVQTGLEAVQLHRPGLGLEGEVDGVLDPLIVSGLTVGTGSSIVTFYHNFFGTLNPRIVCISPSRSLPAEKDGKTRYRPLYAPTCNLAIFLGSAARKKRLPRFNEAFREAAQEDVLFCLESVFHRGCEITMNKQIIMQHVHREGVLATWTTLRKYGRWFSAVHLLFPTYLTMLWWVRDIKVDVEGEK